MKDKKESGPREFLTFEHVFDKDGALSYFFIYSKVFIIGSDEEDHCDLEKRVGGKSIETVD